ncbi:tRNA (adenine(22)-N(1))-methyltransferase [Clostridiales bacterium CHKCI001]|nr:tRNA (adenine(22)-N(1))-methyltransferase [Clostridiales bacterium CHKCI001]
MKDKKVGVALSKRLQVIASFVTPGNRTADIGCDHGFVPIYLVKKTISPKAIAMDIGKGPLQRAARHIQEYGLEDQIETRLSNGMEQLKVGEVDTVILSGIGGPLMIQILEAGKEIVRSLKELVLSPQSEIEQVRRYLVEHLFLIKEEKMVLEDGKYYVVMHVMVEEEPIKKEQEEWKNVEYRYGKSLLKNKEEVFLSYLNWEERTKKQLLDKLKETKTNRSIKRQEELESDLYMIQEAWTLINKN